MKHLYKISILLLLALLMPVSAIAYDFDVDGISSNLQKNKRDNYHFLSGDISISTSIEYVYYGSVNIDVSYSGHEDVSLVMKIDGEVLDSVHSNIWSGQYYGDAEYFRKTLQVDVKAEGYYDLHGFQLIRNYSYANFWYSLKGNSPGLPVSGNCFVVGNKLTYEFSVTDFCHIPWMTGGDYSSAYLWSDGYRTYAGNITIPSTVSVIGDYAFNVYTGSYTFGNYPNTVTEAYPYMAPNTAVLSIPSTIKTIEHDAFGGYGEPYTFSNVRIDNLAAWCSIDFMGAYCNPLIFSSAFSIDDVKINDLVIPNSIPAIRSYAFAGCPGVNTVILPISVIYGRQVF